MDTRRIVVVGTSAGGIEALRTMIADLREDFPAPICIVMHTAPQSPGVLPEILARSTRLPAAGARDLEQLIPGKLYVAPPDFHLIVEPGRLRLTKGPHENRFRPAIDPLFRSAAQVYGPAAIGVVLSGNLDDGTAGLWAIKRLGGIAIVQEPSDALFPSMPLSAINHVDVDHVVPVATIAPLLTQLTAATPDEEEFTVPDEMDVEVRIAKEENPLDLGLDKMAQPSNVACPECHGVLLTFTEEERTRFRCHTGHAYSAESLLAAVDEAIGEALWNSIRALEEGCMLMRKIAEHVETTIHHQRAESGGATHLRSRAEEAHRLADVIREVAMRRSSPEGVKAS